MPTPWSRRIRGRLPQPEPQGQAVFDALLAAHRELDEALSELVDATSGQAADLWPHEQASRKLAVAKRKRSAAVQEMVEILVRTGQPAGSFDQVREASQQISLVSAEHQRDWPASRIQWNRREYLSALRALRSRWLDLMEFERQRFAKMLGGTGD